MNGPDDGAVFVMISDVADCGEWKSGISAAAPVSASAVSGRRRARVSAGSLAGWILAHSGCWPDAALSAAGLSGIRTDRYAVVPLACHGIIILLLFYRMDSVHQQITRELEGRRSQWA